MEEVVVFRLELETFPTMATSNIYLHLDLHFTVDYNYGFDVKLFRFRVTRDEN